MSLLLLNHDPRTQVQENSRRSSSSLNHAMGQGMGGMNPMMMMGNHNTGQVGLLTQGSTNHSLTQ